MKVWLLLQIAGPLGAIIRPIIAATFGVIIAIFYEQIWLGIYKVGWLRFFVERVIAALPPDVVHSLTPPAIGAVVAIGAWAWISNWMINKMKSGNRQIQNALNATPAAANVEVDGIILRNGETAKSVSRLAYDALYPTDENKVGPEIRRPLP